MPEDRAPLRKLHGKIKDAELSGEADTVLELLERAPTEYRAVHALVSFLPRMLLDESPSDGSEYEAAPGDVPSSELDAIEAEETEEVAYGDENEEVDEPAPSSEDRPTADKQVGELRTELTAPTAAEDVPTTRTLGILRRSLLGAVRAEQNAFTRMWKADHRAGRLETEAAEASAALDEASHAARAAAARSEQLYATERAAVDSASASMLAGRAAECFQLLAEAETESATVGKKVRSARESAARAREDTLSRIRDTHRILQRASDMYFAYLASVSGTRSGARARRASAARAETADSEDSEEPHGGVEGDRHSEAADDESSELSERARDEAPSECGVESFMSDPTVEGVALLMSSDLLAMSTDWLLRDRVQTWLVCDRRQPIPPWVRARELVVLEARWRVRQGLLPSEFLEKMSVFSRAARHAAEIKARDESIAAALMRGGTKGSIAEELDVPRNAIDRVRKALGYVRPSRSRRASPGVETLGSV